MRRCATKGSSKEKESGEDERNSLSEGQLEDFR